MKVKREEALNSCFVLTGDQIKRFIKHFEDSDYFIFKAVCIDKAVREFSSVSDLVQFENPPNKEIKSLGINVFSKEHDRKAYISLSKVTAGNIYIQLEGEEDDISKMVEFIQERLSAMRPWYAFISGASLSGHLIGLVINWVFAIPFGFILTQKFQVSNDRSALAIAIYIAAILIGNSIIYLIWLRIRDAYFPMGEIAIGQGVKRYKDKDVIRTTVILGILISLVTGLVMLLIS